MLLSGIKHVDQFICGKLYKFVKYGKKRME